MDTKTINSEGLDFRSTIDLAHHLEDGNVTIPSRLKGPLNESVPQNNSTKVGLFGKGGMDIEQFSAEQTIPNRHVALKTLKTIENASLKLYRQY